jgi:hypothetical protein
MLFPSRVYLEPHISFDNPITLSELTDNPGDESIINSIISRARQKLARQQFEIGLVTE